MQCREGIALLKPPPSTWITLPRKDLLVCNVQEGKICVCGALVMSGLICGHADMLKSARCAQRLYSPYLLIRRKIKDLRLLSQNI